MKISIPMPAPAIDSWTTALRREHRDDHQDDRADALGPGRAAEEQPPHDDRPARQPTPPIMPMTSPASGRDDGDDEP